MKKLLLSAALVLLCASGNDNEILKNPKSRTNLTIEK